MMSLTAVAASSGDTARLVGKLGGGGSSRPQPEARIKAQALAVMERMQRLSQRVRDGEVGMVMVMVLIR
jgi:hypothetical protein